MKKVTLFTLNILLTIISPFLTFGIVWFTLEDLKNTKLGIKVLDILSNPAIFWITISLGIFSILCIVIKIILKNGIKAKVNNFFIHLMTWISCVIVAGLTIYVFYSVNPLTTETINITTAKKIGVGVLLVLLVAFQIAAHKIEKIIDRKLQAYDTAIEMNQVGRGSVIFINILKLVQVIFPEIIILILLCLITSWNIANYFVLVLIACLIPVVGNIISDFNIRSEIKINAKKKEDAMIQKIANKVKRG